MASFENFPKFSTSCLSFLYPKQVTSLGRQVDLTFFCTREHLLGIHWMLVKLKWVRTDECLELKHMKGIYTLIYWRKIFYFSYDFVSQIRSSSMTRAQIAKAYKGFDHRPNPHLTHASTRPQLIDPLSLHFTRIFF